MRFILIAVFMVLTFKTSQAITVNETTDFSAQPINGLLSESSNVFDLSSAGSHSIGGSLSASCSFALCADGDIGDAFSVQLGANLEITSIIFTTDNSDAFFGSTSFGPDVVRMTTNVTALGTAFALQSVLGNGSADFSQSFGDQLISGLYTFGIAFGEKEGVFPYDLIMTDWRVDISVSNISAVPLPASGLLFLAGLAGLGAMHRLRKHAVI